MRTGAVLKNSRLLVQGNIIAFALTVVVNSLAGSTTVLGGKNTAAISDAHPTLVTPAGYVFSIWGVIYILLALFVLYQALPRNLGKEFQKRIGWLFALSSAVNIAWLFLWQFEYLSLSVPIMFLLLGTLTAIYLRLGIGKSGVSLRERLLVHLPFSVYLGWITIASIANVAIALVSVKTNGLGLSQDFWASAALIVVLAVTLLVIATRKDIGYSLVAIWAFLGIAQNHVGNQTVVFLTESSAVIVVIALVAAIMVTRFRKNTNEISKMSTHDTHI